MPGLIECARNLPKPNVYQFELDLALAGSEYRTIQFPMWGFTGYPSEHFKRCSIRLV